MSQFRARNLLALSGLALGCLALASGCGGGGTTTPTEPLRFVPFSTASPTTVPTPGEFVFTPNFSGTTDVFSVVPVTGPATLGTPLQTGNSPVMQGAGTISVLSNAPVGVALEVANVHDEFSHLTTYGVNPITGALSFLSDQTSVFTAAFPHNIGEIDYMQQLNVGNQTVAYLQDSASADLGAFDVTQSGSGAGNLTFTGATGVTNLADVVNSMTVATVGGNTYLVTFEGDETFLPPDGHAQVETWGVTADGNFTGTVPIGVTDVPGNTFFGDASNVCGGTQVTTSAGTFLIVVTDGTTVGDNNVVILSLDASGHLNLPTAAGETFATTVTTTDTSRPLGVVAVRSSVSGSGFEACVVQQDGTVTGFPINLDGSLGTAAVTKPASNFGLAETVLVDGLVQSSRNPNSFELLLQNQASPFDNALEPVATTSTGTVTFGTPVSTGARQSAVPPVLLISDGSF